jgi:hypothetical protein
MPHLPNQHSSSRGNSPAHCLSPRQPVYSPASPHQSHRLLLLARLSGIIPPHIQLLILTILIIVLIFYWY